MSGSRRSFLGRVASLPVGRVTASWHGGCGSPLFVILQHAFLHMFHA